MNTVISKDGTQIAYDKSGAGIPVILVSGALQYRAFDHGMSRVASLLAPHFTVIFYDRRGRGDSTDTQPFSLAREIEDIEALIDAEGGSAYLFGISSGAALAMEAAVALGIKVKKLAMYEAPYNADPVAIQGWKDYRKNLDEALRQGKPGDAVGLLMMLIGMPPEHLPGMKQSPIWPMFEAVGATLAYDAAAMGEEAAVPLDHAAHVTMPALVMDGSESFPFMHTSAVALANAMPQGQQRTLQGQTHEVTPEALAPVLIEFFRG